MKRVFWLFAMLAGLSGCGGGQTDEQTFGVNAAPKQLSSEEIDQQVKLGRVVDLQTDELGLAVRGLLGLVEVVGVVVDRAEGYPVEQDDKLAPLDVENAVSRRFDHPILQPVPLLLAYLLPELILGVVGQVGLLEDLPVRP